jgi:hypothetical protein
MQERVFQPCSSNIIGLFILAAGIYLIGQIICVLAGQIIEPTSTATCHVISSLVFEGDDNTFLAIGFPAAFLTKTALAGTILQS